MTVHRAMPRAVIGAELFAVWMEPQSRKRGSGSGRKSSAQKVMAKLQPESRMMGTGLVEDATEGREVRKVEEKGVGSDWRLEGWSRVGMEMEVVGGRRGWGDERR